ncbi:MAG: hypothetical protein ACXAB7_13145 [Candidatus Kariarchaeaceae archaeon]
MVKRSPLMYRCGTINRQFVLLLWIILVFLGIIGFVYHERPSDSWLIYFVPAYLVFLAVFILIQLFANLIHNSILQLYSIDLSNKKQTDNPMIYSDLEDIFQSNEQFHLYQEKVYIILTRKKTDLLATCIGIVIILMMVLSDRITTDFVALYGEKPYQVDVFEPVLVLLGILQFVILCIIAIGFMSGLMLLFGFVQATANIGLDDRSSFLNMKTVLEDQINRKEIGGESTHEYIRRSELVHFSIKRFKRKCNSIPEALLPINLILLLIIVLTGGVVYYYIILIGRNDLLLGLTSTILIIFTLLDIYIFFAPQFALHRILKNRKKQTIDSFEENYEIKKYQWLALAPETDFETKQMLYNEIRVLANFIEEIEHLLTWPFDYKQFVAILASGLVTVLLLVDILDFVSIVEGINPS